MQLVLEDLVNLPATQTQIAHLEDWKGVKMLECKPQRSFCVFYLCCLGFVSAGETEDEEAEREEEEEEEIGLVHIGVFTHNPTVPEVGLAPSREPLQPSVEKGECPVITSLKLL